MYVIITGEILVREHPLWLGQGGKLALSHILTLGCHISPTHSWQTEINTPIFEENILIEVGPLPLLAADLYKSIQMLK